MFKKRVSDWIHERLEEYREVHPRLISSIVMIVAAGVSAMVAIAYARLIDWATMMMAFFSSHYRLAFILSAPLFFISAWAIVRYVAPDAGGSGIPQILAEIELAALKNRPLKNAWHRLRLILVKFASSTLAVLGGGAVGREGPTIQISASIFEMFDGVFRKYVISHRSREALLIAGGGAGLAAAFNTPLGGVVFAIEELASQHFKTFKGVLILTVVTAGYVTQAVLGPYLFIGHPTIGVVTTKETLISLVAAFVIGIIGALFGKNLFTMTTWTKTLSDRGRVLLAAIVGLLMSSACILLGADASGGGSLLIRKLLFSSSEGVADVGWGLAIWRTLGVTITYISGCASGIFAPSLAAGAAIGALIANSFVFENHNLIIVLAMIAFLTGATRSPFTCFILVFEMTDRQAAVIPMMAASLLANLAARMVDSQSFYENMRNTILMADKTLSAQTAETAQAVAAPPDPSKP